MFAPPTGKAGSAALRAHVDPPGPRPSMAGHGGDVIVVVKVGSSSITDDDGHIDETAMAKLAAELAEGRGGGHQGVLVSSGAIAPGRPVLGWACTRPPAMATLQALAALGQSRLMQFWGSHL